MGDESQSPAEQPTKTSRRLKLHWTVCDASDFVILMETQHVLTCALFDWCIEHRELFGAAPTAIANANVNVREQCAQALNTQV